MNSSPSLPGLHWQLGVFDPKARSRERTLAAAPDRLAAAAAAASGCGSTAGSKYVSSLADPAAAMAATLERRRRERAQLGDGRVSDVLPRGRTTGLLVPSAVASLAPRQTDAGRALLGAKRKDRDVVLEIEGCEGAGLVAARDDGARARALALLKTCSAAPKPPVPDFLAAPARRAAGVGASTSTVPARGPDAAASTLRPAASFSAPAARPGKPAAAAAQPASALAAAFGDLVNESLTAPGSRYASLVEDEDDARLHGVLSILETKDELAAKMDATTKLQVQVYMGGGWGMDGRPVDH